MLENPQNVACRAFRQLQTAADIRIRQAARAVRDGFENLEVLGRVIFRLWEKVEMGQ